MGNASAPVPCDIAIGPHYGITVPDRKLVAVLRRLGWWKKPAREVGYVELALMLLREGVNVKGAAAAIGQLREHDGRRCERCRSLGFSEKASALIARIGR